MWKKLCAGFAGLGLTAGGARPAEPFFPNTTAPAVGQPAAPAGRIRSAFRWTRPASAAPTSLEEEGFRGSVFVAPAYPQAKPGRGVVPAGGTDAPEARPAKLPDIPPVPPKADPAKPAVLLPIPPESPAPKSGAAPALPGSPPAAGAPAPLFLADGSLLMPRGTTGDGEPLYDLVPRDRVKACPTACPPRWRVWGSAEVLFGMTRHADVPPIVTTGPAALGPGAAGALGQPGTSVLFGGQSLDNWRPGLRAELGAWFDESQRWGAMARFYTLFSEDDHFAAFGNGTNVLNLPQLVPVGGSVIQFPIYAGFPGLTTGSVSASARTTFAGGDVSLRHLVRRDGPFRLDALFGYRQMYLGDRVGETFQAATPLLPGPALFGSDGVRSRNNFYGGQVGAIGTVTWKRLSLEGLGAVALGVNVSDVASDRSRQLSLGVGPAIPLEAIGTRDRTTYFGTAAEGGVKLGWRLTDHARLTFGYTGLYWWNVRRAEDQFALGPVPTGKTTHLYAHMLAWGAEFRY